MATIEKKYLSLTGLETFLNNLRTEYQGADSSILAQANQYADGLADNYDAAGTAATKVKELADGQVAANKAAIGTLENLDTTAKGDLVNAINEVRNSVSAGGVAAAVTMTENTPADGSVLKSYTIKQGDNTVGTINIPKDMVVQSGEVVINPEGQAAGTYIKLVLANATNDEIFVNVGTLVDIYKAAAGASQVQLAIDSTTREISASIVAGSIGTTELGALAVTTAKIADGNVTKTKLSAEVQATLDKADAAAQDAQDKADAALEDAKEYADGLNTAMDTRVKAVEGTSHSHSNKTVLDGISATKVSAWDAAEQNAKDYADGLNEEMDGRMQAVEGKAHEHSNKALLDTYKQTEANLADAVSKKHAHENKTVLDGITADKVSGWDAAATGNHAHGNKTVIDGITADKVSAWDGAASKAHEHANKALLDSYTQTEANLADAVAKKHEHTNKTVLDGITSEKVAGWDALDGKITQAQDDMHDEWSSALETHTTQQASFNAGINGRVKALEDVSYVEITEDEINAMFP